MKRKRIGNWVIDNKLGEGGMGKVWQAHHHALKHPVAIKIVTEGLLADQAFAARFVQEAGAQALLQHPNILGVVDFFEEAGEHYLVLPFVDGQSLEDRLRTGPLPLDSALALAGDVLSALDHAHQQGVIHRDVKPSNILLDRDGRPYLADFGIALMVGHERQTRTGAAIGTPHYMSPEQINRPRQIDHRTDLYSFGCVLYEMLTGRPPFDAGEEEGDPDFIIKQAHVQREPEPLRRWNPAIPDAIEAVVLRALAKDPDDRFDGCAEFARRLAQAAHGLMDLIHCASCGRRNRVDRSKARNGANCSKCGVPLLTEMPREIPKEVAGGQTQTGRGTAWKLATAALLVTTLFAATQIVSLRHDLNEARASKEPSGNEESSRNATLIAEAQREKDIRKTVAEHWPLSATQINILKVKTYVTISAMLQNNFTGIKSLPGKLRVKHIGPDGSLLRIPASPPGFSFEHPINLSEMETEQKFEYSWDPEGDAYDVGTHRIELWWDERKIGGKSFDVE